MTAVAQWERIGESLRALRSGTCDAFAFCRVARGQALLLQALPQRYGEVLHDLLDRIEASASFTDESCSFSRNDLLDTVQAWLDQARTRL